MALQYGTGWHYCMCSKAQTCNESMCAWPPRGARSSGPPEPPPCHAPRAHPRPACPAPRAHPQFSLALVVKESFKVYKAVSEGIINLADAFFEMEYYDASEPGGAAHSGSHVASCRPLYQCATPLPAC